MKNIFLKFISLLIVSLFIISCDEDDDAIIDSENIEDVSETDELIPSNLILNLVFNNDDHSIITITPEGDNVSLFHVYFGDSEDEDPTDITPGDSITHQYEAGDYTLVLLGESSDGIFSEITTEITVDETIEEETVMVDFEIDFSTDSFDGGISQVTSNPYTTGNDSNSVLTLVKGAGATWAGSKITSTSVYELSESFTITMDVWSPRSGLNLLMKFEDSTAWPDTASSPEVTAITTVENDWETLSYTFENVDASVDYTNLVLIMDNGTEGDGSANYTIYVDNISVASYLDFENSLGVSSFDGGSLSIIDNPDTSTNSSSKVGELIKGDGATWAGSKLTVTNPFDFSNGTIINIKVWAPREGLNLLMKFEDDTAWPDTVSSAEVSAVTHTALEWEDLSFDFTGISTDVDFTNIVLIIDNGTVGDGSEDYILYVDDISQH